MTTIQESAQEAGIREIVDVRVRVDVPKMARKDVFLLKNVYVPYTGRFVQSKYF